MVIRALSHPFRRPRVARAPLPAEGALPGAAAQGQDNLQQYEKAVKCYAAFLKVPREVGCRMFSGVLGSSFRLRVF